MNHWKWRDAHFFFVPACVASLVLPLCAPVDAHVALRFSNLGFHSCFPYNFLSLRFFVCLAGTKPVVSQPLGVVGGQGGSFFVAWPVQTWH